MSDQEAVKAIFNILVVSPEVKSVDGALNLAHDIWDKVRQPCENPEMESVWQIQNRKPA